MASAQLIRRDGKSTLWSRGDEVVSGAFPEVIQAASDLPNGTVLDGEIVAWNDEKGCPLPFTRLQRRLNRQTVEMTFWPETPVIFVAFDVLEIDGTDVRGRTLSERRRLLASLFDTLPKSSVLRLSDPAPGDTWQTVQNLIGDSRQRGVEGVMLKRLDSPYQPGRPAGLWWKLKVEPFTVDAVLMAAESGRRPLRGIADGLHVWRLG